MSLMYLVHCYSDARDLALSTVPVSKNEQRFLSDEKAQTPIHKTIGKHFFFFFFNQHCHCHSLLDLPTLG